MNKQFILVFFTVFLFLVPMVTYAADPDAVDDDEISTDEDTAVVVDVLANDTDDDGDTLRVCAVTQGSHGTVAITNGGGDVTYTPDPNWNGTDTFTYTIKDTLCIFPGGTDTATVTVTVDPVNDAPDAVDDDEASTDEDTAVVVDVLGNDTDVDGDTLKVDAVTQGSHGSVAITNNGDDVTYTPNEDWNGEDSFTYTATDGTDTDTATVTVTVDPVNDSPDAVDDEASTDEDTAVVVDVLGNDIDVDGDTLKVDAVTQGGNGSVAITNGGDDVTYTPNPDWSGEDSFTYTATDGTDTDTATVTVTVGAANDPPEIIGTIFDQIKNEDADPWTLDLTAYESDKEDSGTALNWSVSGVNTSLFTAVVTDVNNDIITFTPVADAFGSDTITLILTDSGGLTDTQNITVTLNAQNDAPEIIGTIPDQPKNEDADPWTLDLTAYESDIEDSGTDLDWSVSGVNSSLFSAIVTNVNNDIITFTPVANAFGSDNITLTLTDSGGLTDTQDITVTLNPQDDDAPVVTGIPNETIPEGENFATINLDDYVSDADAGQEPEDMDWSFSGNTDLSVSIDGNRVATITPLAPDWNGSETITFTAEDPDGLTGSDDAIFTVTGDMFARALEVLEINTTSATVEIEIVKLGQPRATEFGICWSTEPDPTIDDEKNPLPDSPYSEGTFPIDMTGLEPGTTYYVKAYGRRGGTIIYGSGISFSTFKEPAVTTEVVKSISDTTATVEGNITYLGVPNPTAHGVCWDTSPNPTPDDKIDCKDEGPASVTGLFESVITGLLPNTRYYAQAYVTNAVGTVYGGALPFFTEPSASGVATGEVTNIFTDTATANGSITSLGEPPPTSHGFCWSTDPNPTVDDGADGKRDLGAYSGDVPYEFEYEMTDLESGTLYYVRTYVTSAAGTKYGNQVTFTTAGEASSSRATVIDTPPGLTSDTVYSIRVGGIGVVSYKYQLDNGGWGSENPVSDPMEFTLGTEGLHSLDVIGKNAAGFWQSSDDPTQVKWIVDLTPPTFELSNYPRGTVSITEAEIRVGGSDVVFYRYLIDDNPWSSIYPVSSPIVLSDLSDGPHILIVIGSDLSFNWTESIDIDPMSWTVDTTVPTAVLSNLPDSVTAQTSLDITVGSTPAGPAIEDYVYTLNDGLTWSESDATNIIQLTEMEEGTYTLCVNGFGSGVWQDGEDGQTSLGNATCVAWRVDLTPADAPELAVSPGNSASTAARLSWTWRSDDSEESIQKYRVWYSSVSFDETTLDTATAVFCDIVPGPQGYEEQFIIEGLLPGQQYHFAVDSIDRAGNVSALSKVVNLTTADSLPEIASILLKTGVDSIDNSEAGEVILSGSNFLESEGCNIVRFENSTVTFELSSKAGSASEILADIPIGAPIGTYQARVINKNGISNLSSDTISIVEAEVPLPMVRAVTPVAVPLGDSTALTITGDNFGIPPIKVNLLADDGSSTELSNVSGIDENTVAADVDETVDLPEGRYGIQIVNTESLANDVSAANVELYRPVILDDAEGAVNTVKIIDLMDLPNGMIRVRTTLATDDRDEAGSVDKDRLKVKVHIEPGSMFEEYDPIAGEWVDYSGLIQPPRQVPAGGDVLNTLGVHSVQFTMGTENQLRLKNNQTMFVTLEVTLPSNVSDFEIFYIESDGTLTRAGVDGTWQGMEISQGGTVLAIQPGNPEADKTTYTIGLLLTHMSDYAVGSILPPVVHGASGSNDTYSACFVETTISEGAKLIQALPMVFLFFIISILFFLVRISIPHVHKLLFIMAILLGIVMFGSNLHAGEGAAAGAPTDETVVTTPGGVGVAAPSDEKTMPQEQLKPMPESETEFIPAGASSKKKIVRIKKKKPWHLITGIGFSHIGKKFEASNDIGAVKHELDNNFYPVVGGSYEFSKLFSLEFSFRRDFYSGTVRNSPTGDSSDLTGYTIGLTSLLNGKFREAKWLGTWKPFLRAGFGYRFIENDLDYPVSKYSPALGPMIGVGIQWKKVRLLLDYSDFKHKAGDIDKDYTGSGTNDNLDTSGFSLEFCYLFSLF